MNVAVPAEVAYNVMPKLRKATIGVDIRMPYKVSVYVEPPWVRQLEQEEMMMFMFDPLIVALQVVDNIPRLASDNVH